MKKIQLVFWATFMLSMFSYGQITEVSINVSSTGITEEAAKSSALRLAIEQAFGTFVSSRSEILNDSLVEDQIVSISNGNIKKFEVLSSLYLADQKVYLITVNATVSLDKLASFVQSKGYNDVSFDGGGFAMNLKIQRFNETSEKTAISNLLEQGLLISENIFDRELKIGSPILESKKSENSENSFDPDESKEISTIPKYKIKLSVSTKLNQNWNEYYEYFKKTLLKISMTAEEQMTYTELNKKIYKYAFLNKSLIESKVSSWETEVDRVIFKESYDCIDTATFRTPDALIYLTNFYTMLSAKYMELVSICHELDTVNLDIRYDAENRIGTGRDQGPFVEKNNPSGLWFIGSMPFDNYTSVDIQQYTEPIIDGGRQVGSKLLSKITGSQYVDYHLQEQLFPLFSFTHSGYRIEFPDSLHIQYVNNLNSKDYKTEILNLHENDGFLFDYYDLDRENPIIFDLQDNTVGNHEITISLSFTEDELEKIKTFRLIKI